MMLEKIDTFYDLDRIYSTIERMLVLIRQLSGVSRLGESGRSMSVELQLLNAIDDKKYQLQELQDAVTYLFSQFRKIYVVNKDLYTQLIKRGGRIFELEKQLREQSDSKCLYYMADVIKYEPSLLAMQRVLERTIREIRIFRKQRNKHKLELCISHIRNENFDKAFDEFFSFENSIQQLPQIIEEVFENSIDNLIKLLLFLRGYYYLRKPNSNETFVTACEHIVQYLKCTVMFCRVESLMIYSLIDNVLSDENDFEDFYLERLELLIVDLAANKEIAIHLIQTDPEESSHFAKLFNYISEQLLLELIRQAYNKASGNLINIMNFIGHLPCINQSIICYQELHTEMRQAGVSKSSCILVLAYHIRKTMQNPKFNQSSRAAELVDLKAILPPNVVSILWKHVTISRYESRILIKFSNVGKSIGFSRYTADKNRFELEPVVEGTAFRIRNVAINAYLVEKDGDPIIVGSKVDPSSMDSHWHLVPYDDCTYFRIINRASGRCLFSSFSEKSDYDFYDSPEVIRLTQDSQLLSESNSNWKIEAFSRGPIGESECTIL
ncbi:uncharacterized protein LOC129727346 [Wyeomyia smithii]|uniref:uncharacterized protein LOC129727346 n=1 Tax=Wyeomyia smithii TaxID=174621 RepID=UPI002467B061|nr:uncharacterized protein LOC129727346 [Wyeomyia smithii]XP_055541072.1 uncharacterized protein LOC129727346 [Wyeomyia smithii]XP_055541073.1 uncharacterized protein LOC129727346 [Wyeomyia smithii]XP_055541074.1 uncharacterized protein LOC129727346 [Wyeomyia smithii]XP_055541075.1 uncharacterized protein LOC129727346 [Wyeomyia smithii]XP_055541076.1 uncharacterized protein LOC129727346 [Wyeomyia smithii]